MIYFIFALALVVRLISLNQSLWWDETISAVYAQSQNFHQFVLKYPLADFHPPGYFAIIWFWGRIFGFSEISLRIPSVIFGVLTIVLTYLIGKKISSKKIGVMASLLLTFSPLHIYYSQEARMYSFAAFAVTLSIYYLLILKNKLINILMFAFACTLILYSDYVAYFIIPAEFIFVLFLKRDLIKPLIKSAFIILIFYIPWLTILPFQIIQGQDTANQVNGWRSVVGGSGMKNILLLPLKIIVGKISFFNKFIYYAFSLILSLPYLVVLIYIVKKTTKDQILLWIWIIVPLFLALLVSFIVPVFSYFRFIFILPAISLLLAIGVSKLKSAYLNILLTCLIMSELIPTSLYLLNPVYQREDWRGAINYLNQNVDKNSVVTFEYNEIIPPYIYYRGNLNNAIPGLKQLPVSSPENILEFDSRPMIKNVYLIEYLKDISDPKNLLMPKIEKEGFINTDTMNFNGVGFIRIYAKK